jgi:polyphosphate kinase
VKSLIRAAEHGKQVACVMEIKARFDEERNLHWAAELERVGAHVTFGVCGSGRSETVTLGSCAVARGTGAKTSRHTHTSRTRKPE